MVDDLRDSRPADAVLLDKIADTATAFWVGDWYPTSGVRGTVAARVGAARAAGAVPVLVVYSIPARDCGGYSAGGADSPAGYRAWIDEVAAGLGAGRTAVVLEPDALAGLDCLSSADQGVRYELVRYAGVTLTGAGATVYLDAGHPSWLSVTEAANRLRRAGIDSVRGFALNTSNFATTASNIDYGEDIVAELGGEARFVVDTSRNGAGPAPGNEWCNPPDRALGARPTTSTGSADADALLWVKAPGESDGTCNGGPSAGTFWTDYALGLAARASW